MYSWQGCEVTLPKESPRQTATDSQFIQFEPIFLEKRKFIFLKFISHFKVHIHI